MATLLLRRVTVLRSKTHSLMLSQCSKFSTPRESRFVGHDRGNSVTTDRLRLSPLFSENVRDDMTDCKIELVDDATWHVSSGLADAWRGDHKEKVSRVRNGCSELEYGGDEDDNGVVSYANSNKEEPDFDDIEDMRIRGKLFYKLDKDSKEYEEYKFDFHGRRLGMGNEKNRKGGKETKKKANISPEPKVDPPRENKNSKERKPDLSLGSDRSKSLISPFHEMGDLSVGKKQRSLTFNQQTAPYHEPFCLDIYLSSSSVRASIIHRATSKVVAVSHSISKDMKFDLGSTKNRSACAAVGKVLAQSALADDIHNVVYTPRKGDKLEGKLNIVLKSIMDGGVDVKVKLKQRKLRKGRGPPVINHGGVDVKVKLKQRKLRKGRGPPVINQDQHRPLHKGGWSR